VVKKGFRLRLGIFLGDRRKWTRVVSGRKAQLISARRVNHCARRPEENSLRSVTKKSQTWTISLDYPTKSKRTIKKAKTLTVLAHKMSASSDLSLRREGDMEKKEESGKGIENSVLSPLGRKETRSNFVGGGTRAQKVWTKGKEALEVVSEVGGGGIWPQKSKKTGTESTGSGINVLRDGHYHGSLWDGNAIVGKKYRAGRVFIRPPKLGERRRKELYRGSKNPKEQLDFIYANGHHWLTDKTKGIWRLHEKKHRNFEQY